MERFYRIYAILAPILLHVLLFFIWWVIIQLKLINFDVKPTPPLENELIIFQVIETSGDAKVGEHQRKVKFLSDKNALARNPETTATADLDIGEPHAKGVYKSYDLPKKNGGQDEKGQKPVPYKKAKKEPEKESVTEMKKDLKKKGAAILAASTKYRYNMRPVIEKRESGVTPHDHQQTHVIDIGGLSYDTKDGGDIARYLLALKKRIQRNIHPPESAASWRLILSGVTRLRFKIYKNGKLKDLEILEHKGHESLKTTSSRAIEVSEPFPELPPRFTDPYLKVTVKITYIMEDH